MHRILLPAAPLALVSLLASSCGNFSPPPSATPTISVGSSSSSGDVGVSGGGEQKGTEVETIFFGTAVNQGKRTYTYLVVGPPNVDWGVYYQPGGAGSSSIGASEIRTDHTLTLNGSSLSARFTATHAVRGKLMVDQELSFQGKAVSPTDGWFFLFNWSDPGVMPRHVEIPMPELPVDIDHLASFTANFVAELIRTNEQIRNFVTD